MWGPFLVLFCFLLGLARDPKNPAPTKTKARLQNKPRFSVVCFFLPFFRGGVGKRKSKLKENQPFPRNCSVFLLVFLFLCLSRSFFFLSFLSFSLFSFLAFFVKSQQGKDKGQHNRKYGNLHVHHKRNTTKACRS